MTQNATPSDSSDTCSLGEVESLHDGEEITREKSNHSTTLDLKRTASNVIERVASKVTTRSLREPGPPPDGGLKAWTQVACGWLVIFTTWGYVNSFGAYQTYYTSTLSESASAISWIGSIQVWFTFFIGAFSGRLLDAGYFIPTFVVGMVLQLLGIFLMSISTRYWQLMLTQGVLTGIGGGIFFCPALGLVATYFQNRRALALGIATTGNAVGGIVYPVIVRELFSRIGFAWTTRVVGFVNLGCLALVLALMRPRLPPRTSGPIIDWKAFTEPTYVLFVGGLWFAMWAVYYTFYYIASFGTEAVGMPYTAATNLVIIINAAGVVPRVLLPYFADRTGPLNFMVPTFFIVAIIAFTWRAVHDLTGLYVFAVFYGAASGAFQCLVPTAVASLTPKLNMVGTRLGMAFSTISFAALTGPPIGGALQSAAGGSFTGAQFWSASSVLLAAMVVTAARVHKAGWKLAVKC